MKKNSRSARSVRSAETRNRKRLHLGKQTLLRLSNDHLNRVVGGGEGGDITTDTTDDTCLHCTSNSN
ncbi:hypothetical protein [Haliangium ochraceum]|uniref:hypothetical protein n=1 Tax=Haliangium ochraceum TaxID=80816 RepID=UPI0003050079|nr:hypothetical protein [Haliangium ochraceum]